jgi:hypothetical protein
VYTKDKVPNGLPRRRLDEEVFTQLQQYLSERRRQREELETYG